MHRPMNPRNAAWLTPDMLRSLDTLRRLDDDGYLYQMNIEWDYYDDFVRRFLAGYNLFHAGCSVFVTNTPQGGALTCRNYDYKHRKFNKAEEDITGLNVVFHCSPKGKYRSIGVADAFWLDGQGGTFHHGTLDDGSTDISLLVFLPFVCMDGMNEKGLTVSILSQPIRPGETAVRQNEPGKPRIGHTVLMRYMLDDCANIEEAVALARSVNIVSHNDADYRIFVTDARGASVALEWRYNQLHTIYTDACTNFYVGFDDCEDVVINGTLVERAVKFQGTSLEYRYGYGGGYMRFAAIASQLEMFRDIAGGSGKTVMEPDRADIIIQSVIRGIGPEENSGTQYSAVYDQEKLTLALRVMPYFRKRFTFSL